MGSQYTENWSEGNAILTTIYPVSLASANTPNFVDVGGYSRIVVKLVVGLIAAGGTLNAKVQQSRAANGSSPIDVPAAAIPQQADTEDNKTWIIEIPNEELGVDAGYHYLGLLITPATAASLVSAEIIGFIPRYEPVVQPAGVTVINSTPTAA